MPDLLSKLREACTEMHEDLHVHPLLAPLVSPNLTIADYKAAIAAFYASYRNTEALKPATDFPDSPVVSWLEQDIRFHKIAVIDCDSQIITAIKTLSHYVGFLYVKQGSTLGGQAISKNLKRILGLEPAHGNRFFHGYGDETGMNWKRFISELHKAESTLDTDEAVTAAVSTFKTIAANCDLVLGRKHA